MKPKNNKPATLQKSAHENAVPAGETASTSRAKEKNVKIGTKSCGERRDGQGVCWNENDAT